MMRFMKEDPEKECFDLARRENLLQYMTSAEAWNYR